MYPPNIPSVAELEYPKQIKAKLKQLDKLYLAWAEEDNKLVELHDKLAEVKLQDDRAVSTEALLGGLTKLGEVGASILKFAGYMLLATPILLLTAERLLV